jgi:molybdate transport system substrate-binding protein
MRSDPRTWSAVAAVLFLAMTAGPVRAADIKMLGSPAIREAYNEIVPHFEKATGHKVITTWAGTNDVMKRIGGGETVDVVILASYALDELIKQGKLTASSRTNLVKSGVGVAVRAGAPRIDISSGESIKEALLKANSLAYSSGPSGVYLAGLMEKWGIAEQIKPKLKVVTTGEPVGLLVARGEAEIGFQQVSELLPVKGIDYLGPLPPDIQQVTVFAAAVHSAAAQPEAARALINFIASPEALPAIKKSGMEPG